MGIGKLFTGGRTVLHQGTVPTADGRGVTTPNALIADGDGKTMIGIIRNLHARPPGELIYSDAHRDLTLTFQPARPDGEPTMVRIRSIVITRSTNFGECYTVRFRDGVVVMEWHDGELVLCPGVH